MFELKDQINLLKGEIDKNNDLERMVQDIRLLQESSLKQSVNQFKRSLKDKLQTIWFHNQCFSTYSSKQYNDQNKLRTSYQSTLPHSCLKSLDELSPICLKDMIVNKIHYGKYLKCITIAKPYYIYGIQTLVEDENDEIENVTFYNLSSNYDIDPNDILPEGSILIIKEPYLKSMVNNPKNFQLRVDSPSDVVFLYNTNITTKWTYPIDGLSSEELKSKGNRLFVSKDYDTAIECYMKAIKNDIGNHELYLNLSMAYLKKDQSYLAFKNAEKSISIKPTEKGYYRAGLALYKMRQYEKSWEYLEKCQTDNKVAQEQLEFSKQRVHESKTGRYDFKKIIEDYEKGIRRHDVADYMSPNVKITDIKGKSKGIVALNDIKKGTLLVGSKAVVIAFKNECKFIFQTTNFLTKRSNMGPACLNEPQLCKEILNNPFLAEEIYNLYAGSSCDRTLKVNDCICDVSRLQSILEYNGFAGEDLCEIPDFTISTQDHLQNSGLWIIPSYFNHSCDFNATRIYFGDLCLIFAWKDIKKGDEITMAYSLELDFEKRSDILEKQWDIKCNCRLCHLSRNDSNLKSKTSEIFKEKELIKNMLLQLGSTKKILKSMEKIESIVQDRDDLKPYLITPLGGLGQHYSLKGNYIKSIETFKKVFEIAKDYDELIALKALQLIIDDYFSNSFKEQAEEIVKQAYNTLNYPREITMYKLKIADIDLNKFKHLI